MTEGISFDEWLEQENMDPEFREALERIERSWRFRLEGWWWEHVTWPLANLRLRHRLGRWIIGGPTCDLCGGRLGDNSQYGMHNSCYNEVAEWLGNILGIFGEDSEPHTIRAKRAPGGKYGGPGIVYGGHPVVAKSVSHPGTEAREWEKIIWSKAASDGMRESHSTNGWRTKQAGGRSDATVALGNGYSDD